MTATELKKRINDGALRECYPELYADASRAEKRYTDLLDGFISLFGDRETELFSVPGRSEISGNHTDHNGGKVLAGAIDRDIIAAAARNNDGVIRFHSVGYPMDTVLISECESPENFEDYTSASLIAGMVSGFMKKGYRVGGFDVYSSSDVLKGSGISSSAAYEVMVGNIINHLYAEGKEDNTEIAKTAQYSENVYFGKPSGLMDQMACAVGGFVYIDFKDKTSPVIEPIDFSLDGHGYSLVIVNTGGNHADLNDDYASVPREMKAVARHFGKETLSSVSEGDIIGAIPVLRDMTGDRAVLRALHFVRENDRVSLARDALTEGDIDRFFGIVRASGDSSFKYLQNVYTNINVREQGLSLALALADGYMQDKNGALRVHGGGFAGTIQVFVSNEDVRGLTSLMDSVFGEGAAMTLRIRREGAIKLSI